MSAFYSTGPLPELHENCGHGFECWECGKQVCQRCEVSPGEPVLCVACFDFIGPGGAA